MARRVEPDRLGAFLPELLRNLGLGPKMRKNEVCERWEDIAGNTLARRAVPVGVRGRTLLLQVDNSVWAQEVSFLSADVLARIDELVGPGVVDSVRLLVGRSKPRQPLGGEKNGEAGQASRSVPRAPSIWQEAAHPLASRAEESLRSRLRLADGKMQEELREYLLRLARADLLLERQRQTDGWRECPACGRRTRTVNEPPLCPCCTRDSGQAARAEAALGGEGTCSFT